MRIGIFTLLILILNGIFAQNEKVLLDGVQAVVGNEVVLKSDIIYQKQQLLEQGGIRDQKSLECFIWDDLLFQSLLKHNAEVDSVQVSDDEVEGEIERRLQYFMMQMQGSEEEFKKYFGKTVLEFKEEIRPIIKGSLLANRMRQKITANVEVTPKEVENYYKSIPKDSLPVIEEQYKVSQIVIKPKPSKEEKGRVYQELVDIRKQILKGKDFGLMALLHSEDPGSANNEGELGFLSRNQLVPEFSAVAFNLQPGEVSEVVESPFGYHIIKMIERKGNLINVKHILKSPQIYSNDILRARQKADSVYQVLLKHPENFGKIANQISDDEYSAVNGGKMTNQQTGGDYFTANQLDNETYLVVQNLNVNQPSKPNVIQLPRQGNVIRIVMLTDKIEFHVAKLATDYDRIKQAALENKKDKVLNEWIQNKIGSAYVRLVPGYEDCGTLDVWYEQAKQ
jgi:peptidyl-prolyl cis-trans isomerase SurA